MVYVSGTLLFSSLLFWLSTFNGAEVLFLLLPLPASCYYFGVSPNTAVKTEQKVVVHCVADWSGGGCVNKVIFWSKQSEQH